MKKIVSIIKDDGVFYGHRSGTAKEGHYFSLANNGDVLIISEKTKEIVSLIRSRYIVEVQYEEAEETESKA